MSTPVGIDLGTTFSVIACYRHNRVEVISDPYGYRLIPSMVYYDPNTGKPSVGRMAYNKSRACFPNLIKDAKRIIGRKYDDQVVKKWHQPFYPSGYIAQNGEDMAAFQVTINGRTVLKSPEEVTSEILKYLVKYASEYLGETIKKVVISIPAYFSGAQRKGTMTAAELAGLKVLRLVSEPIAGAIQYVEDKNILSKLMVFDFGGGTLDVSLIKVRRRVFEVEAVAGDTQLGGRNIDQNLFNLFYKPPASKEDRHIQRSIRRLEECCISMKEYIQENDIVEQIIDCYDGNADLELKLDKETFEKVNKDIFQRTIDIVDSCLRDAKLDKKYIKNVILVGGSTRICKVRQLLENYFGEDKIQTDLNPDEAVAGGACIFAANLSKSHPSLEKYKVQEVTPLSLGVETLGGLMTIFIPKNSKLPAEDVKQLVTTENDQVSCSFRIFEGERKNSKYNSQLGSLKIENLPGGKSGDVKFDVHFHLDENGVLNVKATEKTTGNNDSLSVTLDNFRLSEHQIDHHIDEAIKRKTEDDMFEKFIEQRNEYLRQCQHLMYGNRDENQNQKYESFIAYAESADVSDISELTNMFEKLCK